VSRYKVGRALENCHRLQNCWRALEQCRGTMIVGARNLSRCKSLFEGSCAYPDARAIRNLSRCRSKAKTVTSLIYFIVRVIASDFICH
jgi:hypothetical protein